MHWTRTCSGSSPPSKVQNEPSTASSQLSKPAPKIAYEENVTNAVNARGLTLDEIPGLKKGDFLGVGQAHCVFEIEVALAVEVETLVNSLNNRYIVLL